MSLYQFISSNSLLPELNSYLEITSSGILEINLKNYDINSLKIMKCQHVNINKDVFYYTKYKNIYNIEWEYSESGCLEFLNYLKSLQTENIIEVWSIRLCDISETPTASLLESITVYKCKKSKLEYDYLKDKIRCIDSGDTPKVLIILP
ncbi:MAG: hypothetical protein K0R00_2034 [Herbinix sp.]|jgi:hypothetical protein|nr:hypothetical protein [Herbinix sp.]